MSEAVSGRKFWILFLGLITIAIKVGLNSYIMELRGLSSCFEWLMLV